MDDLARLYEARKKLLRQLPRGSRILKGCLVEMFRVCGKPNCRCLKGEKHRALCLSRRKDGKTATTYIPAAYERQARQAVARYHALLETGEAISEINLQIIKGQGKF